MKKTITKDEFINDFMRVRPDNFSIIGLGKLFDYFEDIEQETGAEMELDVIAICCNYTECASIDEVRQYYDLDCDEDEEDVKNYINNNTAVIVWKNDCIIFQNL